MRGFGTEGSPLRIQTSRWFSAEARRRTSTSPGPGLRIRRLLEHEHLGPAVLVDPNRAHRGRLSRVTGRPNSQRARRGARARRARRGAGRALRGDRAAHPRAPRARPVRRHALHDGAARGVVPSRDAAARRAHRRLGRALLLAARAGAAAGPRPAAALHVVRRLRALREKLDELGRRLGGAYRVLVDANQHVDREAAARSGVGFYGKNTLLITRRHGSWVVLGTLVTDVELEPTPPLGLDCGDCRLCIDACPTGALDEPGTLDATRCLSYWTQSPAPPPEEYRAAPRRAGLRLRHLPGRLPVEPRRREAARRASRCRQARAARLARRLAARPTRTSCGAASTRLYVPRNDGRRLRLQRARRAQATWAATAERGRCAARLADRGRDAARARARGRSARLRGARACLSRAAARRLVLLRARARRRRRRRRRARRATRPATAVGRGRGGRRSSRRRPLCSAARSRATELGRPRAPARPAPLAFDAARRSGSSPSSRSSPAQPELALST